MSAPAHNAAPEPARPKFWDEDRWKALIVLATVVGSIFGAIAFVENRVNAAVDDEIEKVTLQLNTIRGDLAYMRGRTDQNAEDMGAIKADIATVKTDIAAIKTAVSRSESPRNQRE